MTDAINVDAPGLQARPAPRLSLWLTLVLVLIYLLEVALSSLINTGDLSGFQRYLATPDTRAIADLGSGGAVSFQAGEIWTLITSCYLHNDLFHLSGNLLTLLILMPAVQRHLGLGRTFILYSLAGTAGSLASALWGEPSSVGASGGLMGISAASILIGWRRGGAEGQRMVLLGCIFGASGIPVGFILPQISNAAHIGGFIAGLVTVMAMTDSTGTVRGRLPAWSAKLSVVLTALCLSTGGGTGIWRTHQALADPDAYESHMTDRAFAELNASIAWDPDAWQNYMARAGYYEYQENWSAALADYSRAIELVPDEAEPYRERGDTYFLSGDYKAAVADYTTAIKLKPFDIEALYFRAQAYRQLDAEDAAKADEDAIVAALPLGTAEAMRYRADVLAARGDVDGAIADITKAIQWADEPNAEYYQLRSGYYASKSEFALARQDMDAALQLEPRSARLLQARGGLNAQEKKYAEALADYKAAMALGVDDSAINNNMAWSMFNLGQAQDALPYAQKALQLMPDSVPALDTRGHIYAALGQRELAIADFRAVLARNPSVEESREGLRKLGVEP